jgi:hypothetical protein
MGRPLARRVDSGFVGGNGLKAMENQPTDETQANVENERLIREKAYQLWQADGAPEGKADHYWHLARKLISECE